jgi:hypothetical protein
MPKEAIMRRFKIAAMSAVLMLAMPVAQGSAQMIRPNANIAPDPMVSLAHYHHYGHGYWYGNGWGWAAPAIGLGLGLALSAPYYYPPPYYARPYYVRPYYARPYYARPYYARPYYGRPYYGWRCPPTAVNCSDGSKPPYYR